MDALLDALTPRRARARWPVAMAAAAALLLVSGLGYALGTLQTPFIDVVDSGDQVDPNDDPPHGRHPSWSPDFGPIQDRPDLAPVLAPLALGTAVLLWNVHAQFAPASVSHASTLVLGREAHTLLEQQIRGIEDRLAELRRLQAAMAAWAPRPAQGPELVFELGPELDMVRRSPESGRRLAEPPRDPASMRTNSLSLADIESGLRPSWRDIEVCFREWRERKPYGRGVLDTRVSILPSGQARVERVRFDDRVVSKCVAGAVHRSRFAPAATRTVVDLDFVSAGDHVALRGTLVP